MSDKRKLFSISTIIAVLGGYFSYYHHYQVDEERFHGRTYEQRYYLPSAQALRVVSTGYQVMLADFLWVRTVLIFSDFATHCDKKQGEWLKVMLHTITQLDPGWRTSYFWGGTMLSVCEDVEGSDKIYLLGYQQFPDDYFFPFSLSANASMHHKDKEKALHWMKIAASKPKAPAWYHAAVAGLISEGHGRKASIKFLHNQLKEQTDPGVKAALGERLRLLLHEDFTEKIKLIRAQFQREHGRDIRSVDELSIPFPDPYMNEPFLSTWILAPDGEVRAQEMDRRQAEKQLLAERALMQWKPPQ